MEEPETSQERLGMAQLMHLIKASPRASELQDLEAQVTHQEMETSVLTTLRSMEPLVKLVEGGALT